MDAAKETTDAETKALDATKHTMNAAVNELYVEADSRFDDSLSEKDVSLTEEDMARATEVIVPAPAATATSGNQATDSQTPDNQLTDNQTADNQATTNQATTNQAEAVRQPVPYVSQQEFASAALMPDARRRVSLGRAVGVSAAVGVAGVSVASILTKEDASLSRAATPDDEKSADEIASNIGVGDDMERVEVPAQPHVTVTYEDMTAAAHSCGSGDAAVSYGADYASVDPSGMDDMSTGFDDTYDSLG